jgi:hypothetical protein
LLIASTAALRASLSPSAYCLPPTVTFSSLSTLAASAVLAAISSFRRAIVRGMRTISPLTRYSVSSCAACCSASFCTSFSSCTFSAISGSSEAIATISAALSVSWLMSSASRSVTSPLMIWSTNRPLACTLSHMKASIVPSVA